MIEVSEIYVDVSDVYVLCPHCHERQGYWYVDPKGANTVCDRCERDFSVNGAAELQMEGANSSTNHSLVEKLQADYAAQGLALKAAKAMQAGETERADRADKWRQAIDDALIVAHLGTAEHDDDPVVLLEKLIKWHVDVALDPAVSEKAIALIEAEREACAQVSLAVMKNPYADRVRWVAKLIASDIRDRGEKGGAT